MQVELLRNTSNTNSFNRNITKSKSFEVVLKDGSDMLSPSIILEIENPSEYNMMKIPAFGNRYYFIGWKNINNDLWEAYTKEIDVLFTYKDTLLKTSCVIDKQETNFNSLLDDGTFISQVNSYDEVLQFDEGFSDTASFILITAGAKA